MKKFIIELKYKFSILGGSWRIKLGFCPLCNSDAPEVYDCPLCDGYQQASGDKFPPAKYTKSLWRKEWGKLCKATRDIHLAVLASRNKRLNTGE